MTDEDKNIGRQIGNYRVIAEIGSGGFGKVYQSQHIFLTERIVAIKFLHTHLGTNEECEQFLQEARFLEKLKHPYMLHVFDVGIDNGFPYLVTEYAPEKSLRKRMKQHAPGLLPAQEVFTILSQVGQALSYAHQQHIIHRDLKPENILFNARGEALLSDFGIATTLSSASVKAVGLVGTPLYMAPEQFQGVISKESDQYSLGCIAYELVTGRPPFMAPDFFALTFQHLSAAPVPPRQYNPGLPLHVEQAILKALAKQRNERHADIQAFIQALRTPSRFQAQMPTIPVTPPPVQSPASYIVESPTMVNSTGSAGTMIRQSGTRLSHESDSSNMLTVPSTGNQQAHFHDPVTPLPSLLHTPSGEQMSFLPFSPPKDSGPFGGDESPTFVLTSKGGESGQQTQNVFTSSGNSSAAARGFITPPPVHATNRGKSGTKRPVVLFAAICIPIIAVIIGVLVFALPANTSSRGITPSASTTTTTLGQATINPTHKPTRSGPKNPVATATHQTTSTPTTRPTASSTPDTKPSPVVTSTPTIGASPTPIPTVDPTPTPPISENFAVPFTSSGVSTTNSYSGTVTISVSGTGQAGSTKHSDAFYYYTNASDNPVTPTHPSCWVLYINGQLATNFTSLPSYNQYQNHFYTFQINVPAGQITFDVCDNYRSDNTGQYYITVTQN